MSPHATPRARTVALAVSCSGALVGPLSAACTPPPTETTTAAPIPAPAPACTPVPAEALAYLTDATCPWVLVPGEGPVWTLRRTDAAGAPTLAVTPPEDCAGRCSFSGAVTALGPVLLAVRADPLGELADAAFVGAAPGGRTLRFAPLWFGRPASGDSTLQGPVYALAPWVCEDSLVLTPEPRLPGAASEEPTTALKQAGGVYELAGDELRRVDRPVPKDMKQCTRIILELP